MATAEIRAKASLDKTQFESGIASMKGAAASLKGVIAGAFSVGAVVAFGKASIGFAAQLQDMADQFGITASEADGFARAIRNAGGSTEKANAILRQLQAYQEKTGDTRTLSQFIESLRTSYEATGDFGKILEVVGTKNAAVFTAALNEMKGGLESFNDAVVNSTAQSADRIGEQFENAFNKVKLQAAKFFVYWEQGVRAGSAGLANLFSEKGFKKAFDEVYEEDEKRFQENETRKMRIAMKERRSRAYSHLDEDFVGPISPYSAKNIPQGFIGPMPQAIAPEKRFEIPRFDDLRRIGGGIIGGKSTDTLREIYKSLEKSRDFEKETADNTAKIAREIGGGSNF